MKWKTDPRGLSTLQKLVDYEIRNKQHLDPNSATQALLWLTRYDVRTVKSYFNWYQPLAKGPLTCSHFLIENNVSSRGNFLHHSSLWCHITGRPCNNISQLRAIQLSWKQHYCGENCLTVSITRYPFFHEYLVLSLHCCLFIIEVCCLCRTYW